MTESQDRYFAKDIKDTYFIIQEFSGKTIPNSPSIYTSIDSVDDLSEIPELVIKLVMRREIKEFTDYIVIKEVDNFKYLMAKPQITGADRITIMDWYYIPREEWTEHLDEPIDSFFERFRIR